MIKTFLRIIFEVTISQQIFLSCYKMMPQIGGKNAYIVSPRLDANSFSMSLANSASPSLRFPTPKVKRYLDSKKRTIQTPSQEVFGRLGCSSVSL